MLPRWKELLARLGTGKEDVLPSISGRRYGEIARLQRLRRFLKRTGRRERASQPARS